MTVSELIDAHTVELGDHPWLNPDARLLGEEEIHMVCPGLIEVYTQHDGKCIVRIAHFSVQEYLESERIIQQDAAIFSVIRPKAHAEIALICLAYLLEPALSKESLAEYPFAFYAAEAWDEHFRDGGRETQFAQDLALRLFRNSGQELEKWLMISDIQEFTKLASPVYYASLLGLNPVLSQLLCENLSADSFSVPKQQTISDLVNAQGGFYGNALQAASARGHKQTVKLLCDKGADINAQNTFDGTALQAASAKGHEQIVKLLLDMGADINAQNKFYGTVLPEASARGHKQIIKKATALQARVATRRLYLVIIILTCIYCLAGRFIFGGAGPGVDIVLETYHCTVQSATIG